MINNLYYKSKFPSSLPTVTSVNIDSFNPIEMCCNKNLSKSRTIHVGHV